MNLSNALLQSKRYSKSWPKNNNLKDSPMRYFAHLILVLSLLSTQALANNAHSGSQLVELIVFRQSSETLPASRLAPDDWARNAVPITADMQRTTQLDHLAQELT